MTDQPIRAYAVDGMTCDHCRAAVNEEVGAIPGIESADVDLVSGRLEVRGAGVSDDEVKAAVEEAGYRLAEGR